MEGTVASVPPQGGRKHPQQDFLQVALQIFYLYVVVPFFGIDKIISNRVINQA